MAESDEQHRLQLDLVARVQAARREANDLEIDLSKKIFLIIWFVMIPKNAMLSKLLMEVGNLVIGSSEDTNHLNFFGLNAVEIVVLRI